MFANDQHSSLSKQTLQKSLAIKGCDALSRNGDESWKKNLWLRLAYTSDLKSLILRFGAISNLSFGRKKL
jgi:hypothetical protein